MSQREKEAFKERLREAESYLSALRNQEVDAVVGQHSVQLLRLKELEDQYHSLIENLPDIVFRITPEEKFQYVSPASRLYFKEGGKAFKDVYLKDSPLHKDNQELLRENLKALVESGDPQVFTFPLETPHGSRYLQVRLFPEMGKAGEMASVLGMVTDITERKKAENALRASEERLRLSIEATHLGMYEFDEKAGRLHLGNGRMCSLMGFHESETSEEDDILQHLHPQDRESLLEGIRSHDPEQGFDIVCRVRPPHEEVRWIRFFGRKVASPNGDISPIIGVAEDVTEQKISEGKLLKSMEAAERAYAIKSKFVANISHEIRTPLTSILGYTDILRETNSEELRDQAVESITESGNLLLSIINDVLDLSKLEATKTRLQPRWVSPQSLLVEVTRLLEQPARKKDIPLKKAVYGQVPNEAYIDPDKVKQILVNLVSNAIKFTEKGYVELSLRHIVSESLLQFTVSDTGIGILPQYQDRIFEPFEQATESGLSANMGTGLGLAICQNLTEAMGGSLILEKSDEKGTVFSLNLPLQGKGRGQVVKENHDLEQKPFFGYGKVVVLVVDDDPSARTILSHYLDRWGCTPIPASSGPEALRLIRDGIKADFVLLDIRMPGMDGLETITRMKEAGLKKPVVGISAHVQDIDKSEFLNAGFSEFLSKPIDRHALFACMKQVFPASRGES